MVQAQEWFHCWRRGEEEEEERDEGVRAVLA